MDLWFPKEAIYYPRKKLTLYPLKEITGKVTSMRSKCQKSRILNGPNV